MINHYLNSFLKISFSVATLCICSSGLLFEIHAQVESDSTSDANSSGIMLLGDTTSAVKGIAMSQNRAFAIDTLFRSPWGAVGRSFLIPGWGQWYNDSKWKAPVFMIADVSLISVYLGKNKKVNRIEHQRKQINRQINTDPFLTTEQKQILQSRYNNLTARLDGALNDRNVYGWYFAISHLLGMVDAYVDAHLYKFKDKMDIAYDPSLNTVYLCWRVQW
ncbi:DUF1542 domain-containing protein [bacterium]|nr:MAG: DUF1542 domain-containing protein [bacterium]